MGRLVDDECLILLTQSTILSLVLVNLYSTRTFGLTPRKMLKATVLEPTHYTSPGLMLHSVVLVMKRPPIHTETLSLARRRKVRCAACLCLHAWCTRSRAVVGCVYRGPTIVSDRYLQRCSDDVFIWCKPLYTLCSSLV
jgi:hypothetical protein